MNVLNTFIFGARATAASLYKALSVLEPEKKIKAFLVSDTEENVLEIWGCPVKALSDVSEELTNNEKNNALVYVAVPELVHRDVKEILKSYGFRMFIMLDSRMEADVMERFFEREGKFKSVHSLPINNNHTEIPKLTIYVASFYKDKPLENSRDLPTFFKKLYLGCACAIKDGVDVSGQADFYDNTGDNISEQNPKLCELTAHYWVWKNRLNTNDEYVGICHYRRILDLTEFDLKRIAENDVDVILPYPMLHYPNAGIHHRWYVSEQDWESMRKAVSDIYPEYAEIFDDVFQESGFYNYNILLAKKNVFADYCAWLYPLLHRIEELTNNKRDRYAGYVSESLETLYFMANFNGLKIFHTGRLLFT